METDKKQLKIEPAEESQLGQIMELYGKARHFMAQHGNPTQWPPSYPSAEMVAKDIQRGRMFVCMADRKIAAVFYYCMEEELDYREIQGGFWLNREPYGVVHRIASDGTVPGCGSFCLQWAWEQCGNLKIDTHRDNVVMQNLLKKNKFRYCGIIHIRDGGERLAYQKAGEPVGEGTGRRH